MHSTALLKFSLKTLSRVLVCLAVLCAETAVATDKVVLQLKWEHEFQFAGYYAAQWQGYYDEEGLDVDIRAASRPDGTLASPAKEVAAERAHFGIGAVDILIEKDHGNDLVVLAPIFQRSPSSLFSLPSTPIKSVRDLQHLRIATPADDFTRTEVRALLKTHGLDPSSVTFVDVAPTIDVLLDGTADVIATYSISANYSAKERNLQLNELTMSEYRLEFYGDTLYTHQRVIESKPEMVKKFVRASVKGWEYALKHKAEIATRIAFELPRELFIYRDQQAYNLAFAEVIDSYMAQPFTEVGHNNRQRWQLMAKQLQEIGIIDFDWELDSLFELAEQSNATRVLTWLFSVGIGGLLILMFWLFPRQKKVWPLYIACLSALLFAELTLESDIRQGHQKDLELKVVQQLNSVAAKLIGAINSNLSMIHGLATHISLNPDIDQQAFAQYGKAIFREDPLLRNMAAAPDLVIRYMYPLEGNEAALGLDYRKNAAQRDAALRVMSTREMVIAGPVDLVQGGVAFIGRTAVYTGGEEGDDTFWGIVSSPIDAEALYRSAGMLSRGLDIDIAIRGKDGLGKYGKIFFGAEAVFTDPRSLQTIINVGDGSWQLAASPKQGWQYQGAEIWLLRTGAVVVAMALLLFLIYRQRQLANREVFEEQIKQSEKLLQEVGKLALISGWKVTPDYQVRQWSRLASKITGVPYVAETLSVESFLGTVVDDQVGLLKQSVENAIEKGTSFDIEMSLDDRKEGRHWVRVIGNAVKQPGGKYEVIGAVQDISERKAFTEVIQRQATYDILTELPNRFLFNDRLNAAVSKAYRDKSKLAILFIDLDNFKPVNDNLGHKAGDQLLQQMAARIKSCVRDTDTVARYSGDEFTVILQDIADEKAPLSVTENILECINQPFTIMERDVFCSASIGISIYPDDGVNAQDLVSNADHAMYEVKKSGRNGWHYFTAEMQAESERRHSLHTKLQKAIARKQLEVFYQPIVELNDERICKCEALVRWFDEDGKMVPTEEFIALAEETGLINDIDRFVLRHASEFLKGLAATQGRNLGLSVNVSPRIFSSKDKALSKWLKLVKEVAGEIDLVVEITERLLTQDTEKALEVLHKVKACGATVAIDDFGTGYSSLSYLTKFPIDIIKIDRSFTQKIGSDAAAETLTDTILSLARKLRLQVVAEGVEEASQLSFLQLRGCEYAQGYYLGRPQNGDAFAELVMEAEKAS